MEFDDCPHREKNGWTGVAQLAMETWLWNYDAKDSYVHFLRMMLDAQRPNGAVPCILPCSPKFGFFWGYGPAWDAILFDIPWQLYRFYDSFIATHNTSFGEIKAGWRRVGGKVEFICETPKDIKVSDEKTQSLTTSR